MERKVLVDEIVRFSLKYRIFNTKIEIGELRNRIECNLKDSVFVENLINTIIVKTNNRKKLDIEKLKELPLELEKIRLDLEYKDGN